MAGGYGKFNVEVHVYKRKGVFSKGKVSYDAVACVAMRGKPSGSLVQGARAIERNNNSRCGLSYRQSSGEGSHKTFKAAAKAALASLAKKMK